MRPLIAIALLGAVAVVFALPSRTAMPRSGEVWVSLETNERIVIDDVGLSSEIVERYREHNASLDDMDMSDRSMVSSLVVPVANEADSLRMSFSYLGEQTVAAEPGAVYIVDGQWHGEVPVTVAYVYSVDWLHAKYQLETAAP